MHRALVINTVDACMSRLQLDGRSSRPEATSVSFAPHGAWWTRRLQEELTAPPEGTGHLVSSLSEDFQ